MLYETVNIRMCLTEQMSNLKVYFRAYRKWFHKNRDSLILFFGILAVGMIGFEAGFIHGMSQNQDPIHIELAPKEDTLSASQPTHSEGSGQQTGEVMNTNSLSSGACTFVASRNSKLFHASTCAVVKRIKPANKLCFKDVGEAEARGLKQGCMK